MSDKLYQIQSGAVTLHVEMKYDGITFEFRGFTLDGDENYYQPYISPYTDRCDGGSFDGRPRVDLSRRLFDKLKALADEQLGEYLDQHIHDAGIYVTGGDELARLWCGAGTDPNVRLNKDLRWSRVSEGVVGLEINQMVCLYDFTRNEIIGYRKAYSDEPIDVTLLYVFYGGYLDQILALEQYKRGLAPPVYAELAKLNKFLRGKKSLKLVMKDGAVHEYKHHSGNEVCVRGLLCFNPKNTAEPFSLENSYDLHPGFSANRPLSELDYLQYGREKHYIDADALRRFAGKDECNG